MSSPHLQDSPNDRSSNLATPSDASTLANNSNSYTSSSSHQPASGHGLAGSKRTLAPLSTSVNNPASARPSSSSNSPRNPWSPTNPPISSNSLSSRQPPRSSSISIGTSPFNPPTTHLPHQQQSQQQIGPGTSSLNRPRTTTSGGIAQLSFNSAPTQSLSNTGATASPLSLRPARASPSVSQSNIGSPTGGSVSNPHGSGQSGSLSKIVIAQVFLLLSTIKEEDRTKWESQADQIRKLAHSHGPEVFIKFLRRLLVINSPQMFHSSRNSDSNGTFPLLVNEVQKLLVDPQQSARIVDAVDGDGDAFKDFDLSSFMDHFKMNSLAKTTLSSAFKRASKPDLRSKADAILSNNLDSFIHNLANPSSVEQPDDPSPLLLATIIDRLAQYPPRSWSSETAHSLHLAVQQRYSGMGTLIPVDVSASLTLFELLEPHNSLVHLIQKHGPRTTQTRDKCRAVLETAELQDISYQQVANTLLFMVLARDDPPYAPDVFISALREHRGGQRLDWQDVLHSFDRDGIKVTKPQFKVLFDALMPLAHHYENFDIQLLWGGEWHHGETQLMFASAFLSFSQEEIDASEIPRLRTAFGDEDFEDASEEVKNRAQNAICQPFVSLDAAKALFSMVFRSSDTYAHAQSLGVIENVINPRMDLFVCAVTAVPKPWGALQDQAMKQLIGPFFFKNVPGHNFVFHLLRKRDEQWLALRMQQFYQSNPTSLRLVWEHANEHGMLNYLINFNNEMSLDLAAFAHGHGAFNLETWLEQITHTLPGPRLLAALSQFLRGRAEDEVQAHREELEPSFVPLSVKTVHLLLKFLGESGLPEDEQVQLHRSCIHAYPRLINYGEGFDKIIDANGRGGNAIHSDADGKMQEHYKLMYSGERQVRDIIEDLQKYKTSEDSGEQDLFACMIFGLFDEYNCFGEYPMDALATTAVLFGSIINFSLLSRIALKAALSMVLESVRDYPPQEKMYKFGLQALLHFKDRLEEWKIFSERLLQVPGLRGTQIEGVVLKIVRAEKDGVGDDTQHAGLPDGELSNLLADESQPCDFTALAEDPPLREDFYEEPHEDIKETVLFILNNVSERNMDAKFADLRTKLAEEHHQWFANYLVEQRIKPQPNFQPLYQDLLDRFGDRLLWDEVQRETYSCIFRMLNAEATMNSSSERALLKNLGVWLGSITLARNQPIKFRNISFRDFLVEAHDSQRLVVAIPFTCNVLSMAAKSPIFKPPCAWTMEIVEILIELYRFASLKLQLKFEIEILCKALGIDEKKIEASNAIRSRPTFDDAFLPPPISDGLDGFGDLSMINYNRRGFAERLGSHSVVPELADVSSMLKHNYSVTPSSPAAQNRLQQIFTQAVERAVPELIGPIVERSVTIAVISASQLVAKDFATEADATRYQNAAHTIVRHLAGNLALITGKDPTRASIGNNIRNTLSREQPEQAAPEGAILTFINENLENICSLIQKAAENASTTEIDAHIALDIQARSNGNLSDPQINRWAYQIPDPYKPSMGGLNGEQMSVYDNFGRAARASLSHTTNASQDSGRQIPDVLQDQLASMTNISTTPEAPAFLRQNAHTTQGQPGPAPETSSQHLLNGFADGQHPEDRVGVLVAAVAKAAVQAAEENPYRDLTSSSGAEQAWTRLRAFVLAPAQPIQRDNLAWQAAQNVLEWLYSEQQIKSSVLDVLAKMLRILCEDSDRCKQNVFLIVRSGYDRLQNTAVTVAMLKNDLLDYRRIDLYLADQLNQRNRSALDFFNDVAEGVLFSEPPSAFRADFAHCMAAIAQWQSDEPGLHAVEEIARRLHETTDIIPGSPLSGGSVPREAQIEYILEEWVRLQHVDPQKASFPSFIRQMHLHKVMGNQESSVTFLKTCIDGSVAVSEKPVSAHSSGSDGTFVRMDALAKLLVLMVAYHGQENGTVKVDKAEYFESMLSTVALIIAQHYCVHTDRFNQKAFFRLLNGILCEVNGNAALFAESHPRMISSLVKCFGLLQPQTFPAFSFAWLSLISHRALMPVLLNSSDQKFAQAFCDLLSTHFLYMGELLKPLDISRATKDLYRGTLEVLLVLHHDFPEFLVEWHFQLLGSIPQHCTQMRSLILSASIFPYPDLPDPLVQGLKVDQLEESRKSPVIRADIAGILQDTGIRQLTEDFVRGASTGSSAVSAIARALETSPRSVTGMGFTPIHANDKVINALVLYLVQHAEMLSSENSLTFSPTSAEAHLMAALMEHLSPEARYHLISAIANQLRYPNSHTLYFCHALFHLFRPGQNDQESTDVQMQIIRVLMERFIVHRPHPWGLMVALLELVKNRQYGLWDLSFMKALPDLERMMTTLLQQLEGNVRGLG